MPYVRHPSRTIRSGLANVLLDRPNIRLPRRIRTVLPGHGILPIVETLALVLHLLNELVQHPRLLLQLRQGFLGLGQGRGNVFSDS